MTELLKIHPSDDMAVALVDLAAGAEVEVTGQKLQLLTAVPAKHKVYLRDFPADAVPRLYGMPVGHTRRAVQCGEAATPENLAALQDTLEASLPELPDWHPPDLSGLPTTFQGYRRADGKVGTRNYLLVVYTVLCAQVVAERAVSVARKAYGYEREDPWLDYMKGTSASPADIISGYPGVDDITLLQHDTGCAIGEEGDVGPLLDYMAGYIHNPNVGGVLVLGLGCEKTSIRRLQQVVGEAHKPIVYLEHQQEGAEDTFMRAALDAIKELMPKVSHAQREPVHAGALVLGTECGGSDGFSGITANPAVGVLSDLLVAQGGSVMLPEVPEMFGGERLLAARAATPQVSAQVLELVQRYLDYARQSGTHLAENPSPGNVREGLTTIQIKSLGAIQKGGTSPVMGVLDYAQPIIGSGLHLLDTPGYDVTSTSALAASGANLMVFTTGLGTPTGNPVTPVIKIATNHRTANNMADIIDFDAGAILDGESLTEVGRRLYKVALEVASGRQTANEVLQHYESAFWSRSATL